MAPTLVLVPGSFSTPDMYDPVVLPLREKDYSIHVLDLPCYPNNYKKGTAPPSMMDDAKAISDFVEKLADEKGEDVVLMAHSYGGRMPFIAQVDIQRNQTVDAQELLGMSYTKRRRVSAVSSQITLKSTIRLEPSQLPAILKS
jgi:hypothetical protein